MGFGQKIGVAQQLLREHEIPMWLIYSDSSVKDHSFDMLGGKADVSSYMLITPEDKRLIVHSLDAKNQDQCWEDDIRVFSNGDIEGQLVLAMSELGFSGKFATNYSARCFKTTDRIPAGRRDRIEELIVDNFFNNSLNELLPVMRQINVSADEILLKLYDRKTPTEVERLKFAAERADYILGEVFSHVRPGMDDHELMGLVERIRKDTYHSYGLNNIGVVHEGLSWEREICPIILTGKTFSDGGHSRCSGEVVRKGNTLYFDYGVKHTYSDGGVACSDIQRMGYVLRDDEVCASEQAQLYFDVVYAAISAGAKACKVGVSGADVDDAVRSVVNEAGFNYDHDTGHPIGHEAQTPGTPFRETAKDLFVQPGGVYTIEPRIQVENGCSIEEMIHVGLGGVEFLSPRQNVLYLVK